VAKNELSYFPEGLYIQVSTVQDLFQAISKNPVRIIVEFNSETKEDLLVKRVKLPISKKQLIISLDPYCPASKEETLLSDLNELVSDGYKTFVVNNIAHISMLRGKGANLIAGPYLYTFNRWAASWFENQNIGAFITPLENSWDNLKMTWEESVRDRVLVTAYAYPALFRMRFKLPESYDFLYFMDKEETVFKVNSTEDGSVVMPEAPFSIVDKSEILNSAGFKRILLDFSRTKVSRQELKMVTSSMIKRQPVPESSRFNWKNGFYSPEKMEIYKAMNEKAEAEKEAGLRNPRSRAGSEKYKKQRRPGRK
jgi:putative protease